MILKCLANRLFIFNHRSVSAVQLMELKIFTYLAHSSGEIIGRNFKLGRNLMFQNAKVVCGIFFFWFYVFLFLLLFVFLLHEVYNDSRKRKSRSIENRRRIVRLMNHLMNPCIYFFHLKEQVHTRSSLTLYPIFLISPLFGNHMNQKTKNYKKAFLMAFLSLQQMVSHS